jgi:hypothetical protein
MSWGNVMSYSTDASVDLDTGQKGRKAEREMKRDGSVGRGRGRGTRIRHPDVTSAHRREDGRHATNKSPTSAAPTGISSDLKH